jgi:hypothetical protein
MKSLSAILAATLVIAGTSLAAAQGDTTAKPGTSLRGADTNPTVPGHSPASGNPAGKKAMHSAKPMKSAPVSSTGRPLAKPKKPFKGTVR